MHTIDTLSNHVLRGLVELGSKSRVHIDRFLAKQSKVGDPALFDKDQFKWTTLLEKNWQKIDQEMREILRHRDAVPPLRDISPDHKRIAGDGLWRSFFLWAYGIKSNENTARCPKTTAIIEQIPGLKTALFSILAPGAHIPRHTGVTKALVVCHLGLKIPKKSENCHMWLNGCTLNWQAGKSFVFDDTYPHEVRNNTDEERVVLLLQVKRPLRWPGELLANFFLGAIRISPFITDAKKQLGRWEQKYRNAESKD
ncbi:Aspartyl/Asparaginyl beta-hydroxylase [hydrothermal vent metagenome]|uniref:Aspartyl/Asparaginyl beta-hydroxylase n=1 Tax=hydrothermal vent metagenome TaxID=652676 RepID=A0A3B0RUU6_9ZZZZ